MGAHHDAIMIISESTRVPPCRRSFRFKLACGAPTVIDKEVRTKKKTFVDANDVAKLLLTLIFVLDGLGKPELDASRYNRQQVLQ